jgi:protein-S-isoprenylcysteine O-methyltransferase Ste14
MLLIAGLEVRFGGTETAPLAIQVLGWLLVAGGYTLFSWAMASNNFFSGLVRIQSERGHTVASGGPYRWMRHPGYVGMVLFTLGTPALLGTPVAGWMAWIIIALIVVRTGLEDRTLRMELPGYAEYAQQVKYRLIPGVW